MRLLRLSYVLGCRSSGYPGLTLLVLCAFEVLVERGRARNDAKRTGNELERFSTADIRTELFLGNGTVALG
ncbi:unnamed protein product [Anisakis simplex]|uniref:Secreted protein n=1 Tax=Anisakis simplex TaxID=6269 RepID=A0A0M3JK10_ANISI|nr:unnamed protein product [Anisakis simplex]